LAVPDGHLPRETRTRAGARAVLRDAARRAAVELTRERHDHRGDRRRDGRPLPPEGGGDYRGGERGEARDDQRLRRQAIAPAAGWTVRHRLPRLAIASRP